MKKETSGQVLIIVLLLLAVVLTIGLSVASRSVTDVKVSQQEEESARALSAAEAGIEQAIKLGERTYYVPQPAGAGNISVYVTKTDQGAGRFFNFGGNGIDAGDTQTLWLVNHTATGDMGSTNWTGRRIHLLWGTEGTPYNNDQTPAIEATLFYNNGGTIKVNKYTYDPNQSRTPPNYFSLANHDGYNGLDGKRYQFKTDAVIPIQSITRSYLYFLRIKLLYNDQPQPLEAETANGGDNYFPQGSCYESTATVPQSQITRKVKQCESFKTPPGIFDYVLFSETDLTK